MTYNVIREDGVRAESLTKEQIYELIAGTTSEVPQGVDEAFITKLKELNKGNASSIWVGTNAEYNALAEKSENVLYVIIDDTFYSDLENWQQDIEDRFNILNDSQTALRNEVDLFENTITEEVNSIRDNLYNWKQAVMSELSKSPVIVDESSGNDWKFFVQTGEVASDNESNTIQLSITKNLRSEAKNIYIKVNKGVFSNFKMDVNLNWRYEQIDKTYTYDELPTEYIKIHNIGSGYGYDVTVTFTLTGRF